MKRFVFGLSELKKSGQRKKVPFLPTKKDDDYFEYYQVIKIQEDEEELGETNNNCKEEGGGMSEAMYPQQPRQNFQQAASRTVGPLLSLGRQKSIFEAFGYFHPSKKSDPLLPFRWRQQQQQHDQYQDLHQPLQQRQREQKFFSKMRRVLMDNIEKIVFYSFLVLFFFSLCKNMQQHKHQINKANGDDHEGKKNP